MGAIVDTLHLDITDIKIVQNQYPDCVITMQTDNKVTIQKFQVIIPDEHEEDYYTFLVDNCIAMSSKNFVSRALSDQIFVVRMKNRIAINRILIGIDKPDFKKED